MSRHRNALAVLAATALAACGALDPYPTTPAAAPTAPGVPAAPSVSGATAPRVAICYNPLESPLGEVQAQATQECAAGNARSVAVPAETDYYLQNCPLLLPARASFTCVAKK